MGNIFFNKSIIYDFIQLIYSSINKDYLNYYRQLMNKKKTPSRNLYTLNEEHNNDFDFHSQDSDFQEPTQINFSNAEEDGVKEEIERINSKLQENEKQIYKLKIKNKDLKDAADIAEIKNTKHEEKQRELIKKLSHEQVTNRQLQYQVKKLTEEILRFRENYKNADYKSAEVSAALSKAQEDRAHFAYNMKKIADTISHCSDISDFSHIASKFSDFMRKNIKQFEQNSINSDFSFDFKFELDKNNNLKHKISQLEERNLRMKEEMESEKIEKKRIVSEYTERTSKLKGQCESLKYRVEEKQRQYEVQISHLRKVLNEKNEIIYELNMRIEEHKFKKDSFATKKSRVKKRSFIGDGDRDRDITQSKMFEIENQIESLERQLVRNLQNDD